MSFRIKVDPEARKDIQKAIDWYDGQRKGLGRIFYEKVRESIQSLGTNPHRVAIRYSDVRMKKVGKYPYCLHFFIDSEQEQVIILAMIHTSRDPDRNWVWKH